MDYHLIGTILYYVLFGYVGCSFHVQVVEVVGSPSHRVILEYVMHTTWSWLCKKMFVGEM